MRQTKAEIYLHLVWTTAGRAAMVTEAIEADVYRCIEDQVKRHFRSDVLAIGGMPDHVHALVRIRTTVAVSKLVQQMKGVSTTFVRDKLRTGEPFNWQDGYGVFSVSRSHVKRVITYIQNQKQHHASDKLWPEWEEAGEEV